jgi:hypothetical protein
METVYSNNASAPLADLRALVDRYPAAINKEDGELARLLCCSDFEIEEARRWLLEDGLEVRA